ncbi:helix-turn-helix transcriptional regulator [Cohnella nanjingensis]|uniref:Helix-turn-helix transcriptional regulator n=1 Tax=Cohnella nanjingensis TaxID=1387779 RepID=A0A7X0VCU6_9BACL|nr:helix-turn-helix transcriptional regulator [Cohnella nanjingensis]MBB6669265.1 helix-turn-helix transcriptional regulator [Cohnella nanjingensis]
MELTPRQLEIVELVKQHAPITGEQIAELLGVSRPTIRSDLSVLVMLGFVDAKPKVGYFIGNALRPESAVQHQLRNWKVKDRMSRPVVIQENATVNDAVISLFVDNVGSLIVTNEEGRLIGMVSPKDLLKVAIGNTGAGAIPIRMVMTKHSQLVTISPEDSIAEAARRMMVHQVNSLPVIRPDGTADDRSSGLEVVGRITKTNITQALVELATDL